MRTAIQYTLLMLMTMGTSVGLLAQQAGPSIVVSHSEGTDLLGLIQFEEGWGSNTPQLAAYVDQALGGKERFPILQQVRDTIDHGGTSLVAMLNCGLLLDEPNGHGASRKFADPEYQDQLDQRFLRRLFSPDNPSWVEFVNSSEVQTVLQHANGKYEAVERYLGNFFDLKSEIGFLEQVFAYHFDKYVVVPSFFFLPYSGTGVAIKEGDETWSYFVFGVRSDIGDGKAPDLQNGGFTRTSGIASLAVHELAHTFYGQRFRDSPSFQRQGFRESLTKGLGADFDRLGYNNNHWQGIFEEYFVRSIEILYLERYESAATASEWQKYHESLGFSSIRDFVRGIKKSLVHNDFDHVIDSIESELQS